MTQQLEHSWVKEIFTPEELKQYATFEAEMKSQSSPQQKAAFEKNWSNLVAEMKANLREDPASAIGIHLGERCMSLINGLYGKKYAHLRTKKFERGFGEGKGLDETGLTPEIVAWLEKAMDAYWRHRIYNLLNQVGTISSSELMKCWDEVLDDMYGDDKERKQSLIKIIIEDEKVSGDAKAWLLGLSKS